MAYSTINVTIGGETKAAIDVLGNGTQVIMVDSLTDFDKEVMNTVSAATGATFAVKMAATTLANGKTAAVTYAGYIRILADYQAVVARTQLIGSMDVAQKLVDLDAAVVALDARVDVLEAV
jgi:hypothetical protein